MAYKIIITKQATKKLDKLDETIRKTILGWLEKNIEGADNPRAFGKALTGDKKGAWRYRVGSYRIIADIKDMTVTVYVVDIGHRKNVYK